MNEDEFREVQYEQEQDAAPVNAMWVGYPHLFEGLNDSLSKTFNRVKLPVKSLVLSAPLGTMPELSIDDRVSLMQDRAIIDDVLDGKPVRRFDESLLNLFIALHNLYEHKIDVMEFDQIAHASALAIGFPEPSLGESEDNTDGDQPLQ